MRADERERVYGRDAYYWGTEPNELATETVEIVATDRDSPTVVDIGAGEGRDAVFFAERGWTVYAMDVSANGLAKARRLADERNVSIRTLEADANSVDLPESVDIVYSIGTIQYIRPENRNGQFEHFKGQTTPGGVHALFAFVDHPEIPTPPDWTDNEHFYAPGELAAYYDDWDIETTEEIVFEDDSSGEPHEHAAETVIARKPNDP
ncbi:SAM-dependent methyltransferase [Natronorubrum halophilum]|uniref:SAM-dependent methyltransferase n=1 Tax=Natronorubrum halophilum TaxID=1702106 RepID=UPI0010C1D506|nr:class I SAM-dependent methyltransferase [Natronorubrum halophilum]